MAPDTVVAAPDAPPESPPPPRNYWQLPMFTVGLAAAIAAIVYFPPKPTDPATQFRTEVLALRSAVDHRGITPLTQPQIESIASATARLAGQVEQHPELTADAQFAIGSGYVFLADYGPVAQMEQHWRLADAAFNSVEVAALADPTDGKRFEFRRAKVTAARGQGDPVDLFFKLSNPPVGDDDGGERPRLLAEVAMRLNPPDLKRAQIELAAYLGGPPRLPVDDLARLKVRLADIYVRLNEPDRAQPWLEDLARSTTPAKVVADARYRLAKLAAAENNWPKAVELLESTVSLTQLPENQRAEIDYEAGLVRLRLGDEPAAIGHFRKVAGYPVPAARAAAIHLAELIARKPGATDNRADMVALLESAVRGLDGSTPGEIPMLKPPEVQAAFELVTAKCEEAGDFALASRAAAAYGGVAEPRRQRELQANLQMNWGKALEAEKNLTAATAKFRDAATEFATLAATDPNPNGQAELLRRSAEAHRKAGDTTAALAAIDRIPQISGIAPVTAGVAWLKKGEILLASHQYAEAETALQKAMATAGPHATSARVKLALAQIEQGRGKLTAATGDDARKAAKGQISLGQELLAQVANSSDTENPVVRNAKFQALFELGKLLLQQGSIPDAEARFRQLLQLGPADEAAPMAKLYLGSCLLLLARGDHQGGRPPADADRKLAEARTLFEELAETPDTFLQAQADVRLANTTLLLKKYDDMPALCERLARKYQGKVEEVIVLSMLYSAFRFADREADANRTLDRMQAAFAKLGPNDFPGGADEYTQEYWQRQWFAILKPAKP